MHIAFPDFRSIKRSLGSKSQSRQQQRRRSPVVEPRPPVAPSPLPLSFAKAGTKHRAGSEAWVLRLMLAAAASLFIGGALLGNAVSVLLSLFAALACATRVEQKYRNGDYGQVPDESIE